MKLDNVGEIFLSRRIYFVNDKRRKIKVKIGKPQRFPESPDYYCPYQIIGIGNEKVRYSGGIDEIQALQLALQRIGAELYTSEEWKKGKLRWEGDENGDLGFPVPDSLKDLLPKDKEERSK